MQAEAEAGRKNAKEQEELADNGANSLWMAQSERTDGRTDGRRRCIKESRKETFNQNVLQENMALGK
jgi:hypothetical protein